MSEVKDKKHSKRISTRKSKSNQGTDCNKVKKVMLKIFLFIRYYIDLLIDQLFAWYYDPKKRQLQKCTNPIIMESAISLARKIRKRELKSEEVVQAFIDRIKEVNPILNAVVDDRFNDALEEARKIDKDIEVGTILDVDFQNKPFLGVPFTTKESTAVKGLSYTFGLLQRKGRKATFDADYVTAVKESGAICLGVTNVPQLNLWVETGNPVYGTTNNPYDSTRNAGGSSGGEASILAAGGTAISTGTDIGGSVRIPAFMCGVYGHKPSSHLISTKGMTFRTGKEEQTMVVAGVLTRHAEDIAPMLKVMMRENVKKLDLDRPVNMKNLKVYYIANPKDPFINPFRSEMKSTLASAVNYFTDILNEKPSEVEFENVKYAGKLWKFWMSQETNANFKRDITDRQGEVNPWIEILKHFTVGSKYTTAVIFNLVNSLLPTPPEKWAKETTETLRKQLLDTLGENGVLLYPSSPWPASYHHTGLIRPWNLYLFAIWNVLKFPVTQVPMGLRNGLPVGIQVVAAPYQDHLCIAVAKELESAFGGYVPPFQTA